MARYIENLQILRDYIQSLRNRLWNERFISHNKEGKFLPRVGKLIIELAAEEDSLLDRSGTEG